MIDHSNKTSMNGSEKRDKKHDSEEAQGLYDLFVDILKDIYWAEKALVKTIPKMIHNATSLELVEALSGHLEITKEQVIRLERVFSIINETAESKTCHAMVGLIKEAESIMEGTKKGVVRDAGIISASQKVEHYEIASYGTLCAFARKMKEYKVAELLEQTLLEEKASDLKLTEIAETSVNAEAFAI